MKLKFHWGHGILFSFILFSLFMLSFLVRAFLDKKGLDLVESNAYQKGNQYSEKYVQLSNAQNDGIVFTTQEDENYMYFRYQNPQNSLRKGKGSALFFRPSDKQKDFYLSFEMDSAGTFSVPKKMFIPGYWKIKAEWKVQNKTYFMENSFWVSD